MEMNRSTAATEGIRLATCKFRYLEERHTTNESNSPGRDRVICTVTEIRHQSHYSAFCFGDSPIIVTASIRSNKTRDQCQSHKYRGRFREGHGGSRSRGVQGHGGCEFPLWLEHSLLAPLDGSLRSRRLLALGSSANVMGIWNFSVSKLENTGWICLPKRKLLSLHHVSTGQAQSPP